MTSPLRSIFAYVKFPVYRTLGRSETHLETLVKDGDTGMMQAIIVLSILLIKVFAAAWNAIQIKHLFNLIAHLNSPLFKHLIIITSLYSRSRKS
jgi:hypothetical protein